MWSLPNISAMNARKKADAPNLEQAVRLGLLNAESKTFKTKRAMYSFVRQNLTPASKRLFDLLDPRQRSLLGTGHERELRQLAPPVWSARNDKALKIDALTVWIGDPLQCHHDWDSENCEGAVTGELVYDVFSDDPSELLAQCRYHRDSRGTPDGYFYCGDCNRTMETNITWENYYTWINGEQVCLVCAADRYIADADNWIELTPENIAAVDFDRVRKAKHVLAVEMPVPDSITFVENVEMDGSSGGKLRFSMHADPNPNDAVDDLRTILLQAMQDGHKRALLILDGAYQFSVSLGVYVDAAPAQVNQPAGQHAVA